MNETIEWLTDNWQLLVDGFYNVMLAVGGLILIFKRTSTKRLNKKMDDHIIKENVKFNIEDYELLIDGKKIDLSKAEIRKKGGTHAN